MVGDCTSSRFAPLVSRDWGERGQGQKEGGRRRQRKRMQDKLKEVQEKKKKREVMSMRMKQLQHHRDKRRACIDRQAEDKGKNARFVIQVQSERSSLLHAVHAVADITLIACAGERNLLQRAKSLPVLLFCKFFSVIKPNAHN